MHLVFLTERLLQGFGADRVIYECAKFLASKGHQCTIWCIITDGTYPEAEGLKIIPVAIARPGFFPFYEMWALRRLRYIFRSSAPADVWIISTIPFYPYAHWLKPAMVCDFGFPSMAGMRGVQRVNFGYMRWTQYHLHFPSAAKIACISHFVRSQLSPLLQARAEVIYPGREHIHTYPAQPVRAQRGIEADDVVLLYVGRLNPTAQPYKGVFNLRRIFHSLAQELPVRTHLVLAGYGSEKDAQELSGPGIIVEPNLSLRELISWYSACDIYVTASRWEGFNLPFIEAQSFGKPVVGFRVGGHPESVFEGETGYLVSNEKEFVNALKQLILYPDLRWKMGEAAFHFSRKFCWRYAGEKFLQVLQSL